MLSSLVIKRIINRIKDSFVEFTIDRTNIRNFEKYESWIAEYLSLDTNDVKNILKKFERAQSNAIAKAMAEKDSKIFIKGLGVFYIKPTTRDYYEAIDRLTDGEEVSDEEFSEIHKIAMKETYDRQVERLTNKKEHKNYTSI